MIAHVQFGFPDTKRVFLKVSLPSCTQNYHCLNSLAALVSGEKSNLCGRIWANQKGIVTGIVSDSFTSRSILKDLNILNTREKHNHYKRGRQLWYLTRKGKIKACNRAEEDYYICRKSFQELLFVVTATAQPQQMSKPQIYMENFCIYLLAQGQHSPHDVRGETLGEQSCQLLKTQSLK